MPMNSPLISIIIPVYNTEQYLSKCLNSAVLQGFRDTEIIVVDDGSHGDCKEICSHYPEVKYIAHDKNRGLFAARETGVCHASGTYIVNLDSDDWLPLDICENIARAGEFDLLLFEVASVYPSHTEKSRWANKGLKRVGANFFDFYCNRSYVSWALWGKVFRRELALQIFDRLKVRDHVIMSEDCLFFTAYSSLAKNVKTLCRIGYYYNVSNESVNRTAVNLQKLEKHFHDLEIVIKTLHLLFNKDQLSALKNIEKELFYVFLDRFYHISGGKDIFSQFLPRLIEIYGADTVASYMLSAGTQKNILLRMEFSKNLINNRFIRAFLGKLRSIWASN